MKTFYKGTSAVVLTYDITDERSYSDLDYWYKQISKFPLMQNSSVRAKWLSCWWVTSLIWNRPGKYQNKRGYNMRRKIRLRSMKYQPKMALIQN